MPLQTPPSPPPYVQEVSEKQQAIARARGVFADLKKAMKCGYCVLEVVDDDKHEYIGGGEKKNHVYVTSAMILNASIPRLMFRFGHEIDNIKQKDTPIYTVIEREPLSKVLIFQKYRRAPTDEENQRHRDWVDRASTYLQTQEKRADLGGVMGTCDLRTAIEDFQQTPYYVLPPQSSDTPTNHPSPEKRIQALLEKRMDIERACGSRARMP